MSIEKQSHIDMNGILAVMKQHNDLKLFNYTAALYSYMETTTRTLDHVENINHVEVLIKF